MGKRIVFCRGCGEEVPVAEAHSIRKEMGTYLDSFSLCELCNKEYLEKEKEGKSSLEDFQCKECGKFLGFYELWILYKMKSDGTHSLKWACQECFKKAPENEQRAPLHEMVNADWIEDLGQHIEQHFN